jgi:hypothetical protein
MSVAAGVTAAGGTGDRVKEGADVPCTGAQAASKVKLDKRIAGRNNGWDLI